MGFCIATGTTMMIFLTKLWNRHCLKPFSQGEWKCLADRMVSCCMVTFSPLLNCFIQTWKRSSDWWEPDLVFEWLVTTPTLVLELLIVHFTLVILRSRMIITRKKWTCLHLILLNSTIWRFQQKLLSLPLDKINSFNKTFSAMLQFVELPLQWMQTQHLQDRTLKILSGIMNLTSGKIELSEVVSKMSFLMLQIIDNFVLRQWKQRTWWWYPLNSNW